VGIASLGATAGALYSDYDIGRFVMDAKTFHGEPWRILSSTFLHGDIIHLVFNLYWLWIFGSMVEKTLGVFKTGCLLLFFALTSALAEWTFLEGGIGLSGVGYGLFGFLWVLSRTDPRFYQAIDKQTTVLFVAWFFICIIATYTEVMNIANIAHAAGMLSGMACGLMFSAAKKGRLVGWFSAICFLIVVLIGSTFGRPWLNFSLRVGEDSAWYGYQALTDKQNHEALTWFEEALALNPNQPGWWYNLGVTHSRIADDAQERQQQNDLFVEHVRQAYKCYEQAAKLAPRNLDYKDSFSEITKYMNNAGFSLP
jgi:membrane associated rhomboid family serine protease